MKKRGKKGRKKGRKLPPRVVHRQLKKNPKYHLITIDGGDPVPLKIVVNKGDRICWVNNDARDWVVSFLGDWPFAQPPGPIDVLATTPSGWHKVTTTLAQGVLKAFRYGIKSLETDPDPPPDGPGVIVDGG
jgi:hypothetical protein